MLRSKGQRNLPALLSQDGGATSVEAAVLIGVVILCLASGIYALGDVSRSEFASTASVLGSSDAKSEFATNPNANQTGASTEQAAKPGDEPMPWQLIVVGISLFVGCVAPTAYALLKQDRKRKKPEDAALVEEPEPAPGHDDVAFEKRQRLRRVFENNMSSLLQGQLKVRNVMSRQITCVQPSSSMKAVREIMDTKKVRHVLVVQGQSSLVGIISKQDCEQRQGKTARDTMTEDVRFLDAEASLAPAITMLIREQLSCLPVVSGDKLVGVVTTTDLMLALQCALYMLGNVVEYLHNLEAPAATANR